MNEQQDVTVIQARKWFEHGADQGWLKAKLIIGEVTRLEDQVKRLQVKNRTLQVEVDNLKSQLGQ